MPLIEVKQLGKTYVNEDVRTLALEKVNFKVEAGEFVAIMGPSGSGKSTLLHVLGFLDQPSDGEYRFEGRRVNEYTPREIARLRNKKMGFVFQAFNLLPRTSVLENIKLPLVYSDVPEKEWDERAKNACAAVGLAHRISHEPSQLSGGEKQRVAIARALINDPEIIFADEPTGNLDSKSGQAIMEILQDLNAKGRHTVILITHETYTAEHAQRIIALRDGQIESDRPVSRRRSSQDDFIK